MTAPARPLREYSDLCWQLAARCESKRAGRVMRMLAADLRIAAERSRQAEERAGRARAAELAELSRLAPPQPAAPGEARVSSGSASTA